MDLTPYHTNILEHYSEHFGIALGDILAVLQGLHGDAIRKDYGSSQAWQYAWDQLPYTLQNK